ncbi:MAG: UDP-glucose 4-epimerase GalE [Proteobacteria bacterium]|nr:UDP-glucose 4-epimerase GalE [Pseudomonadota bacterium]
MSGSVLVTGGAGYIGSHATLALAARGRRVVVLDDLSTGVREAVTGAFVQGDVGDASLVTEVIRAHRVEAVLHFAGSIVVPESVIDPGKYYENNTLKSLVLARACVAAGVKRFIFSSSAAVYGEPERTPVRETDKTLPINPYGWSKLMVEQMLGDLGRASPDFRTISLRYFNVAGADPKGRAGQRGPQSTHLIRCAVEAATGRRQRLDIFGDDYPTRDGSCERDFIHVSDLAEAHADALDFLERGGEAGVFNCGYGRGYSVKEVIAALESITGAPLPAVVVARREGDPARLISDPARIRAQLGWSPRHDSLDQILSSALAWERSLAASATAPA